MNKKNSHIISAVLRFLKNRPTFESIGIVPYRKLLEKGATAFKPANGVRFEPFKIDAIEAEWAIPENSKSNGMILFVHGGGYIAGSINSHRELGSKIALAAGKKLLLFNYRLAPEHPYPAGLNDVTNVWQWLLKQPGIDSNICVMGDSAGGGLALALVTGLLNQKKKIPRCLVLISPWIDLECNNSSHETNRFKDPMLKQSMLKKTARLYTDRDLADPCISPINNRFKGICPVLIQVGENEILLDDAVLLHKKLNQVKSEATLEIWDNMFHVWHYFSRYLPDGRKAIYSAARFIRRHIEPDIL